MVEVVWSCIYHTIFGLRGIVSNFNLYNKINQERTSLDSYQITRLDLESKASLLRSNSIDFDMLDEMARRLFNNARDKEKIIRVD
ncbi:MAG TPA: septum formation initiator family protein, partial [Candidatus Megaira endosymbiont of Hartmannula sinica]|nr:septum formation initiator family protein [Candidatus Megaera endosymbiont of Hartmannula sinica]